jgi:hypothetical protein
MRGCRVPCQLTYCNRPCDSEGYYLDPYLVQHSKEIREDTRLRELRSVILPAALRCPQGKGIGIGIGNGGNLPVNIATVEGGWPFRAWAKMSRSLACGCTFDKASQMYLCICERVAEKDDFGSCFRAPFHRTQPAALTLF